MYRQFIEDNYDKMSEILNCLKIGVYITDGEGNTLLLNDESCKTGGLTREETVGKNMRQLETQGFIEESVSLEVMKSGKEEAMIQNLGDGDKVYVTGVPLFEKDDIDIIINTERNITETLTLKKLLEKNSKVTAKIREEIEYLRKQSSTALGNMVAEDEETKRLAEKAARVANLDTTVLLTGESGTGKEVFANFIYSNSGRVGRPFIKVNCAAIPSTLLESMFFGTVKGSYTGAANTTGLFEQARNGTLFLDEINSMDISLQAKLLKVIENKTVRRIGDMKEREIRCRILCALNEAPLACIENGKLRRDLYYRLSSCILYIPPLRERKSDIPLLCSFFLKHFNKEYGRHIHRIDPELMDRFLEYPWPGNVRELQHVVESAFSVSRKDMEILQLGHLSHYYREFFTACKPEAVSDSQAAPGPVSPCNPQPLKAYMDSCEKNFLAAALCCHSNNITATARSLQITRQALQHKIRKYGL